MNKRKFISVILAIAVIITTFSLAGCGSSSDSERNNSVQGSEEHGDNYDEVTDGNQDSSQQNFQTPSIDEITNNENILYLNSSFSTAKTYNHTVGLKTDGTVVAFGEFCGVECNVSDWTDIVAVSAGDLHTVGLKADGTVVTEFFGREEFENYGQCNVSDWTDIVAISAGKEHTVGLKSDGTVVAVGNNEYGQCNVSDWTDIVAISAGGYHTVGLKSDGSVVATEFINVGYSNYQGQCDVSDWSNIVAISAGVVHTVGLKTDGTVIAVGSSLDSRCEVDNWTNIVAISAGQEHTVGLKADGTVVGCGPASLYLGVSDWTGIVAICAGFHCTIGLKIDGTLVDVGIGDYGERDISSWTDIKQPEIIK
jgi:alpha-tubulin suppressor-like RCC1 family protein